jgi:hypothetical protein
MIISDLLCTCIQAAPEIRLYDPGDVNVYKNVPPKWSLHWTSSGSYTGSNPAVGDNGCAGSTCTYTDPVGLKVMFGAVEKVPNGTYTFKLYANASDATPTKTLTFSHVDTMANASVTENYVFPFPKFYVNGNGDISSIDYVWMRRDGSVFVNATAADIEMIVGKQIAELKWYSSSTKDDAHGAYISITPSASSFAASGTVGFSDATMGASFSKKRVDITEIAISFTSNIGLWIKLSMGV